MSGPNDQCHEIRNTESPATDFNEWRAANQSVSIIHVDIFQTVSAKECSCAKYDMFVFYNLPR